MPRVLGVCLVLLLFAGACVEGLGLDQRSCPCGEGWICCASKQVCVRPESPAACPAAPDGGEGGMGDAPAGASAGPDAAPSGAPGGAAGADAAAGPLADATPDAPAGSDLPTSEPDLPAASTDAGAPSDGPATGGSGGDVDLGGQPPDVGPAVSFILPADGTRVVGTVTIPVVHRGAALARIELRVDDRLRLTAPGNATSLVWPAYQETLGVHPKAVHRLNVVGVGTDGSRHEQQATVFVLAPPTGDCDSNGHVNGADIAAAEMEASDGDPADPDSAASAGFPGSPACDVNQDNVIDATDRTCIDRGYYGPPGFVCQPPELPAVRPILFLPVEYHGVADDADLRELLRNKVEEARRFFARHNGGRTFRALPVEIFKAPLDRSAYVDEDAVINYENVLDPLPTPGYVEPSNKALAPWNRVLLLFVMGGSASLEVDRYANGHAHVLVGDAYLRAARDLDCNGVDPVVPGDPAREVCTATWSAGGRIYGHTMGAILEGLGRAFGGRAWPVESPAFRTSVLGDYRLYPDLGLHPADREIFARSPFFPGSTDSVPPVAEMLTPAADAVVSGVVDVRAAARDEVGVKTVSLSIDGQPVPEAEAVSPYEQDQSRMGVHRVWDTAEVAVGQHTLTFHAEDVFGNRASASITVTVAR